MLCVSLFDRIDSPRAFEGNADAAVEFVGWAVDLHVVDTRLDDDSRDLSRSVICGYSDPWSFPSLIEYLFDHRLEHMGVLWRHVVKAVGLAEMLVLDLMPTGFL